ncbi:hypothetical protein [Pseudomonas sp. NY15374]|uniref:hypothetical protein n=1 Tax=Pseudomonas sp. NY15374 TaxID=3400357 RepID=UPI003A84D9CC
MSQYCDKVVVLKSVSVSVEAFDSSGQPLKGVRKNTTVQVASFGLDDPIRHPEISDDKVAQFEAWRETQKQRIEDAFIDSAVDGKLGGVPLLKTRTSMGNPAFKVGEFSGLISSVVALEPGVMKAVLVGGEGATEQQDTSSALLDDMVTKEAICSRIREITEGIMRYLHITNRKGIEIFPLADTLDMRAAWTALGCALDSRGIGHKKVTGDMDGRNAANEGLEIFNEIKKHVQEV